MIRVGVNGYHTIGAPGADAVEEEAGMQLLRAADEEPGNREGEGGTREEGGGPGRGRQGSDRRGGPRPTDRPVTPRSGRSVGPEGAEHRHHGREGPGDSYAPPHPASDTQEERVEGGRRG